MMTLERKARTLWKLWGCGDMRYGRCDHCQRDRDEEGRSLVVRRAPRGRRWCCLGCFGEGKR